MKQTVLLVDDEPLFVESLAERLELRGFDPLIARDGLSAVDMFTEHRPPLVVLDLRLPDIGGEEVLRRIRALDREARVVMITGHGSEDDKNTCMGLGADVFLYKPVHVHELVEALKGES